MFSSFSGTSVRKYLLLAVALIVLQGGLLWLEGQPAICACDYVKFWEGEVLSIGNSQHVTDWYTFSHVIHGFFFYFIAWLLFPRLSFAQRFLLAVGLEAGWEVIENTPWVINHYREQALAQGYFGDSILNSIVDTLAMIFGFFLAWRLPAKLTVVLAIVLEVFTGYFIHDGLALNVLNFLHQFDFIREWQGGA
ncbi:MAG: DUF2585 domain-containing protein [Candidatus Paceibacterota bacterium]|jgi:hypothetical protein